MAIEAQGLEIQIGARTLLHPTNFHVAKGDKIGLVGRNGAGKTTLTRVITGDMLPTAGKVRVSGKLGYLPQDTHAADPEQTALDRMMSARDIASIIKRIRKAEKEMTDPDPDVMTKAMNRYDKAMQDFEKAGGYAAQSEATAMAASLGLPQDVMGQQLGTLSGGQRRRIELARILFSDADTLILDEPTNHLDADSIEWLRGYLKKYEGGFLVISHSTELLDEVVNKVWHLDAQLGQIDMYSLGWKAYLHQRVVDEERRRRAKTDIPLGVGKNCEIYNTIIDKNARIGNNVKLSPEGKPDKFEQGGIYVRDGVLVVMKGAVIPDNTCIMP